MSTEPRLACFSRRGQTHRNPSGRCTLDIRTAVPVGDRRRGNSSSSPLTAPLSHMDKTNSSRNHVELGRLLLVDDTTPSPRGSPAQGGQAGKTLLVTARLAWREQVLAPSSPPVRISLRRQDEANVSKRTTTLRDSAELRPADRFLAPSQTQSLLLVEPTSANVACRPCHCPHECASRPPDGGIELCTPIRAIIAPVWFYPK
jgi:hypothetical protein